MPKADEVMQQLIDLADKVRRGDYGSPELLRAIASGFKVFRSDLDFVKEGLTHVQEEDIGALKVEDARLDELQGR